MSRFETLRGAGSSLVQSKRICLIQLLGNPLLFAVFVGWLLLPFGHADAWYDRPSKSRSPFWNLSAKHWLASENSVVCTPLTRAVRVPFWKQ